MKPLSRIICFPPAILAVWVQAKMKQLCGKSIKMRGTAELRVFARK